ncbi:hypothetical protein F4604DRAFT_1814770 [Suillus subluteus]|nr:hypothetical protein F4604DRAFT_1814770 [Suillus subluteus]
MPVADMVITGTLGQDQFVSLDPDSVPSYLRLEVSVKSLRHQVLDEDDQQKKMKVRISLGTLFFELIPHRNKDYEVKDMENFDHENVPSLYGGTPRFGKHIATVSPWVHSESLNQYMHLHNDLTIENRSRIGSSLTIYDRVQEPSIQRLLLLNCGHSYSVQYTQPQ